MLFLPRSFFDASHFTWHRGWQKSHFGDFEHQFHVFVEYYIPNSWVMREMRAFTNPFFIVFLSIHDLQHNVPYFSSNLPGTHLLDRGMVETTKKIISIANTGFVLLRFVTMGVGVVSVDIIYHHNHKGVMIANFWRLSRWFNVMLYDISIYIRRFNVNLSFFDSLSGVRNRCWLMIDKSGILSNINCGLSSYIIRNIWELSIIGITMGIYISNIKQY